MPYIRLGDVTARRVGSGKVPTYTNIIKNTVMNEKSNNKDEIKIIKDCKFINKHEVKVVKDNKKVVKGNNDINHIKNNDKVMRNDKVVKDN